MVKLLLSFESFLVKGICWCILLHFSSAKDNLLQRMVAIKRIDKPFDALECAKRTYRELAIAAHMDHENVSSTFFKKYPLTTSAYLSISLLWVRI